MDAEVAEANLDDRWPHVIAVFRQFGADPNLDLWRWGLRVWVRIRGVRPDATVDEYMFELTFDDYDDHPPRVYVCNPRPPFNRGEKRQFFPNIAGNNVFAHDMFLCMPGDRRCLEAANHHSEWRKREHYLADRVIGSLFSLLRASNYRGPL